MIVPLLTATALIALVLSTPGPAADGELAGLEALVGGRVVSERYSQFQTVDGWINAEENDRMERAIAAHCVGWSGWTCNSTQYHRTAGQLRPAVWTGKRSFGAGHTEHFLRAENMAYFGTPATTYFGTSGDNYRYVTLNSSDDELCAALNFPVTGTYKITGAVRAGGTSSDAIWAKIDPGAYAPWDVEDTGFGQWIWSNSGPSFWVTAGTHSFCVKRLENLDLDVLLVKKL